MSVFGLPVRGRHRARWAGLVVMMATAVCAVADTPPATTDEILRLPPMLVESNDRSLTWQYLELPGFQLLTVCDDVTATNFARRTHRLGEMLRVLVPDRFLFKSSVPETYVLVDEMPGRLKSPEVLAQMLRENGASVSADGVVTGRPVVDLPPIAVPGMRVPARRIETLPNMRLWDLDALGVFSVLPYSRLPAAFTFTEDRVQYLLRLRTPALPDWFVEGVLGLYRRAKLRDNGIEIDEAVWPADAKQASGFSLLEMPELLGRQSATDQAGLTATDRLWQAQCALFVRWCFAQKAATRRESLWKLVDRLEQGPPTEALFRECFGLGFAEMKAQLEAYQPDAVNRPLRLEGPPAESRRKLKLRPATDLEIACIRGDWERLEIDYVRAHYPAAVETYIGRARATLHRVYERGERSPRLLALLGLVEREAGNMSAARDYLEAAVQAGPVRPRAALELARLRYAALPAEGRLTAAQVAAVLEPLGPALRTDPPLSASYALMMAAWSRCDTPPGPEDLARLNEGGRLFPGASAYVLRAIYFNLAGGQGPSARALADAGRRHARSAEMQERFKRVEEELAMQGF